MATRRAGTRRSAARMKTTKLLNRDFAGALRRAPSSRRTTRSGGGRPPPPGRRRGGPVLVDEHQGGDELALGVQQGYLGRRRHHVREQVGNARPQFADGLDQALPVAAHFFFSLVVAFCSLRAERTRSSRSRTVAVVVSRCARTRGSAISLL